MARSGGDGSSTTSSSRTFETQKQTKLKAFEEFRRHLEKLKVEFYDNFKKKADSVCTLHDFEILATLGQGSFGSVVLARHKSSNKNYAIKIMNRAKIVKDKQIEHTLNEKQVLCAIQFPFVVHMEFYFKDNCNIFFVLPFVAGGDMFSLMRKTRNMKEKDAKFYAAQIILALEYLHYLDLIYRDLKPENIVIDSVGYIKITDFGFCKHMVKPRTYTLCGTPEYLAPEIILSKGYGKAVDWWSIGVFIYEMIAGYTPFYADEPMQIYEKITSGKFKFTADFSADARDLIRNILQVDLSRRFLAIEHYMCSNFINCAFHTFISYGNLRSGVFDIKGHDWFKILDWQSIFNRRAVPPYVPKLESPDDIGNFDQFEDIKIQESVNEKFIKEFEEF